MHIALAQLNPIVGDLAGNTSMILRAMAQARQDGASVLVCSELAVLGYPPRDLLLREGVVEACEAAVQQIAEQSGDLTVLVGHPRSNPSGVRGVYNSVSVCYRGEVIAVADKRLLPGYDVFDEDRYFDPGLTPCTFTFDGKLSGVLICEDLWRASDVSAHASYASDPMQDLIDVGCELIFNINASPFIIGKGARHTQYLQSVAQRSNATIIAVNQVGANDDLIFDGRSCVVRADGTIQEMMDAFVSGVAIVDLNGEQSATIRVMEPMEELYHALVLGVRDYLHKTGVRDALVGLSGGIDSAVTAVIGVAALGAEHMSGIMMPSRYSSSGSIDDALALANNLKLANCVKLPIHTSHELLSQQVGDAIGDVTGSLTDENIQARLRGLLLMAVSNKQGSLLLTTSNKSEFAVGYSTLYGDMAGAISVLGDVLKTRVYELARWINRSYELLGFAVPPIPENSITKPPSAELRPNQTDQDSLPDYELLDEIIERYVEREQSVQRIIVESALDEAVVRRVVGMVDRTEFKREQAALILKVSPRTFGRGRSMPIVARMSIPERAKPAAH